MDEWNEPTNDRGLYCDRCGAAVDTLHYWGESAYGQSGICPDCMANRIVIGDGASAHLVAQR